MRCYIYYRIDPARRAETAAAVAAVQADLLRETGVRGELLRRADDSETWMEVYAPLVDVASFEAALAAALDRHAFMTLLPPGGQRKTERFVGL